MRCWSDPWDLSRFRLAQIVPDFTACWPKRQARRFISTVQNGLRWISIHRKTWPTINRGLGDSVQPLDRQSRCRGIETLSTSGCRPSLAITWIKPITQTLAHQIAGDNRQEYGKTWKSGDPPLIELRASQRDHCPPLRCRRSDAQPDKR